MSTGKRKQDAELTEYKDAFYQQDLKKKNPHKTEDDNNVRERGQVPAIVDIREPQPPKKNH